MTITKNKVRNFMRLLLQDYSHPDIWEDGSVNLTRLAEEAAHNFDKDEWLDDSTHWVWDLTVDVAEEIEEMIEKTGRSGTGLNSARSPFGPWG